jgi:hypothetical protein
VRLENFLGGDFSSSKETVKVRVLSAVLFDTEIHQVETDFLQRESTYPPLGNFTDLALKSAGATAMLPLSCNQLCPLPGF